MATIEERAELCQQYQEIYGGNFASAYKKGAEEQKAIDEANPSDAVIMRILNAIGYEEESWIPIVRKNLEIIEE